MAARTKTWKTVWPIATALVLFALVSGGWLWARAEAETRFAAQQRQLDRKPALTCSTDTWSGYPFKMALDCQDPALHLNRGRTKIIPKTLSAVVRAPKLRTVLIHFEGPTVIENDELPAPVTVNHAPATVRVHMENRRSFRAKTELSFLAVTQTDNRLADIETLRLETRLRRGAEHHIDIDADITNLIIHTDDQQQVILAAVKALINADNVPHEPAANGAEWLKAAAGLETQFNVEAFTARYGATELHAEGTVIIEGTGTLDGNIKTRVTKLDAILAELRKRKVLTRKKARTASTLLGLFDKGDGVTADLRLKSGELFWGPVKLGRQIPLF
ncbi:MAG: DUF2125 domain-containing protein [Rhizobiales bacterium]|nr:DUF2125 domain-containing protein [Hyphomicrobiales bacterium]